MMARNVGAWSALVTATCLAALRLIAEENSRK